VDGAPLQRSQLADAIEVDPGTHVVTVSGPHLRRTEAKVSIDVRESKTIDVLVEREPFGTLRLRLKARPAGLAVELDGEPLDLASPPAREVPVGRHALTARAPGYADFRWEGEIADLATLDVPVELALAERPVATRWARDASGTPKWLFFAASGVAAAGLGGGVFFLADASATDRDEQAKSVAARDPGVRDSIRTRAEVGSALLITGAAFAVAAGILAFTTRWAAPPSTAKIPVFPQSPPAYGPAVWATEL
jgi:hypothetical protein